MNTITTIFAILFIIQSVLFLIVLIRVRRTGKIMKRVLKSIKDDLERYKNLGV